MSRASPANASAAADRYRSRCQTIAMSRAGMRVPNGNSASTSLLSTYAYVNPAVAVFLGWALLGEHVGSKEIASGLVILASVAMIVFGRGVRVVAEPTAESLAPYIRRQHAQAAGFPRGAPRLSELRRIAA